MYDLIPNGQGVHTLMLGLIAATVLLAAAGWTAAAVTDDALKPGENLLRNSSFELGIGRFWKPVFLRMRPNPDAEFLPTNEHLIREDGAAHGGRYLHLDDIRVRTFVSKPLPMEPGDYTLSFWARGEPGATVRTFIQALTKPASMRRGIIASDRFDVTDEWKRYSISGKVEDMPKDKELGGWEKPCLVVRIGARGPKAVSFDGVQLERRAEASDYAPRAAVEVGLDSGQLGHIYNAGEKRELTVVVRNERDKPTDLPLELEITDIDRRTVAKRTFSVSAGPGLTRTPLPLDLKLNGLFLAEVRRQGSQDALDEIAITCLPFKPGGSPGFGACLPLDTYHLRLCKDLGMNWVVQVDASSATNWETVETRPGKYDWTRSDQAVAAGAREGFDILGVLTDCPKWAAGARSGRKPPKPEFADHFPKFVNAAVDRYKGKIRHWMVWDEPYNHFPVDRYFDWHVAAVKAARAADPNCKIVGPMTNTVASGWTEELLQAGILDYVDIFNVSGWGMGYPQMAQAKAWSQADGEERPFWNCAAGMGCTTIYRDVIHNGPRLFRQRTAVMAKKAVNDRQADAERLSMYWSVVHDKHLAGMKSYLGTFDYDGTPTAHVVAATIVWQQLAEARPVEPIAMGRNIRGHVFQTGEGSVAVLWTTLDAEREMAATIDDVNLQGAGKRRVEAPEGAVQTRMGLDIPTSKVRVRDTFANPVAVRGGRKTELPLGDLPVFVEAPGVAPAEFAGIIRSATVEGLGKAVSLIPRVATVDGKPSFCLYVINNSHKPGKLSAEITDAPAGLTFEKEHVRGTSVKTTLKPWEERTVAFPIAEVSGGVRDVLTCECVVNGEKTTLKRLVAIAACRRVDKPIKIDGNLDEWDFSKATVVDRREQVKHNGDHWKGKADLSFAFTTRWDKENIYFAARVSDNAIRRTHDRSAALWADDCLEIFFDADILGDVTYVKQSNDDWQMMFAPGDPTGDYKEPAWYSTNRMAGAELGSKHVEGGYTIEIRIPIENLRVKPAPGLAIGMDVNVEDTDPDRKERPVIFWAGDGNDWKDTSRYGVLLLTDGK